MTVRIDRMEGCPVHAARLRAFQPVLRQPVAIIDGAWIETPWGRLRIARGRLGQRHHDVHDTILYCSRRPYWHTDGRLSLLVDPAELRRVLGGGHAYSHGHLRSLLHDLRATSIEWESARRAGVRGIGGILDDVTEATVTAPNPLTGGERRLWRVTFGAAWAASMAADLQVRYDVAGVARLTHGISMAVARLMLGHAPGTQQQVETVLDQIGIPAGQARRNARRRLLDDVLGLAGVGVALDDGKLRHSRPRNTWALPRSLEASEGVPHPPDAVPQAPGEGAETCRNGPACATAAR